MASRDVRQLGMHRSPAWSLPIAVGLTAALLAGCSAGSARDGTAAGPGNGSAPSLGHGLPAGSALGVGGAAGGQSGKSGAGNQAGQSKGGSGSVAVSAAGLHPAPQGPQRLDATSTRGVVAKLPKPSARAGAGISFSPAIFMGPSILGDLGSASWNITHRDADGKMRNWGSTLYLSSTSSNALAELRHSPAVPHYCPSGTTPLAGFKKVGTVTVAVVCHDPHAPGVWSTVFQRADRFGYLVLATSDSSRAEAVATGSAVFAALTALSARVNIGLGVFKQSGEPKG